MLARLFLVICEVVVLWRRTAVVGGIAFPITASVAGEGSSAADDGCSGSILTADRYQVAAGRRIMVTLAVSRILQHARRVPARGRRH